MNIKYEEQTYTLFKASDANIVLNTILKIASNASNLVKKPNAVGNGLFYKTMKEAWGKYNKDELTFHEVKVFGKLYLVIKMREILVYYTRLL